MRPRLRAREQIYLMLIHLITASIRHRTLVLAMWVLIALGGVVALTRLPIDAFPDTTPIQVQINTVAANLSPLEIEQQVTFQVEQSISGIPGLEVVRSVSKFGLSQVTVQFEDGLDLYLCRQQVSERLLEVDLPEGIDLPHLGPLATGLGEVYHYLVQGKSHDLRDLTTIQDWVIRPRLRSVSGVAEVNTWGGQIKQVQVQFDPARLATYGLTLQDLELALRANNRNVGGGYIVAGGELSLVRGVGILETLDDVATTTVRSDSGIPVRVRDLAEVVIGHQIRRGVVTANGEGEAVLGLGFMLMGENSHAVTQNLKERMDSIRATLPAGVEVRDVYSRIQLVDQVIETIKQNLVLGALFVTLVLFAFLGDLRAGLIVAGAIPLSMLCAGSGMLWFGIAGSLMSLGAIDFGLIVDSAVIIVENAVHRISLASDDSSLSEIVRNAAVEVRGPTMFGELIIMIVYLPILTLEGVEGRMFRPMALTVIFALLGSLVMSLTLIPALASLILPRRKASGRGGFMGMLQRAYGAVLTICIKFRYLVLMGVLVLVAYGGVRARDLGGQFIPRLDEGALVINTVRLAGVDLEESARYGTALEKLLLDTFPQEIENAWTRTGTAQVATDPMGLEVSDLFVTLKPRVDWVRARTQSELVERIRETLDGMPGMRAIFTQPIEMRLGEMTAGIRSDLGVKIFGDDFQVLEAKASDAQRLIGLVPGAKDVQVEQLTGQPLIEIEIDCEALSRHGVSAQTVLDLVETIGGRRVGEIREDQRRFDLVLRLQPDLTRDVRRLAQVLVTSESGEHLPLASLVRIRERSGPSSIQREWQKRRILVQANVSGINLDGFVRDVQGVLERHLDLPLGYHLEYGGQFEHLHRARHRLALVVPLALILILLLLRTSTGS